jgi:hypothetical protein
LPKHRILPELTTTLSTLILGNYTLELPSHGGVVDQTVDLGGRDLALQSRSLRCIRCKFRKLLA